MEDVSIRPATVDDAEGIQQVARNSWHAAYDAVIGANQVDETVDSWYDPERLVGDDIEQPERLLFVATDDGEIVGFAEAVPDGEDDLLAHLYRLYVAPGEWRQGIGRSLLDHIETRLDDRGFDRLHLSVMAENDVGVNFYESSGFHRVGTTDNDELDIQQYEYRKQL
jgi:ribosomal protein S18 acetylase RimI-like enzyme